MKHLLLIVQNLIGQFAVIKEPSILRGQRIDVYVWFLTVWFFDAENFISENAFLNRSKHIGCFQAVDFMFRRWMTVKLRLFNNFDFFGIVNKLFTGLNQ